MAKFFPVSPSIWNKRLVRLGRDTALLYAYTLSNQHRASEGLYRLPKIYVSADLDMELEEVEAALSALEDEGLVIYDHEAEVILDPTGIYFLPARSDKQLQGAITKLRQVPKTPLLGQLLKLAFAHNERLAEEMQKAFPHLSESLSEHSPDSSQTHPQGTHPKDSLRDKRLGGDIDIEVPDSKGDPVKALQEAEDLVVEQFDADVVWGGSR